MTPLLSPKDLETISTSTLNHYEANAASFWEGTRNHDVTQNYEALLSALPKKIGLKILDFGCGPGRDLSYFKSLGHLPTGLDGSKAFCEMAAAYSGCPVLHQNFIHLDLPTGSYDGIFANASLFHVPRQGLSRVLKMLATSLKPSGVLFSSNPRGSGEALNGERYGNYLEFDEYNTFLNEAGFEVLHHYHRPKGLPLAEQPWLAVVAKLR
jgi:SAM-dependent methyltransferase